MARATKARGQVAAAPTSRGRKAARPAVTDEKPAPIHKTAVVVIHGIGEQRPLETLREFVETVYRRDRALASMPVGDTGMLDVSPVPDDVTGSAELRRITTLPDGPQKRTDFFEMYWADIMDGTPIDMVTGWIKMLVLRSPLNLPAAVKVRWAWGILTAVTTVVFLAAVAALYPGLATELEGWAPIGWLGSVLGFLRPYLAGLLLATAGGLLILKLLQARGKERRVSLNPVLGLAGAGLVVSLTPGPVAATLAFWAGAVTVLVGWALSGIVGPYAGDVVRYVRATPATVEKRRQVRERGVALLEALHRKRLRGPPLEAFTQSPADNPPLYDRVVIVGHSLGTIIAYDILQLFWEKHGPTHRQDWAVANQEVQAALMDCDRYVQDAWGAPPRPVDAAGFEAARARLSELLRVAAPGWRISDLVTLGSPLAHAGFLLFDSVDEVEQACKERRLATSPPRPDPLLGSMLFALPPTNERQGRDGQQEQPPKVPHFAAQFAAVRWTNLYDEHRNPLLGDMISGRLADLFGSGITDHRLEIRRPGRPGFLARMFTHTQYWAWDRSYEPSQANIEAAGMDKPERERRDLLWHNVPEHIRLLRQALRIGT